MNEKPRMNFSAALTLALIELTSWAEADKRDPARDFWRAWKNYELDVLQNLERRGLVRASHKTNSLQLTDAGKRCGEILLRHFQEAFERYQIDYSPENGGEYAD